MEIREDILNTTRELIIASYNFTMSQLRNIDPQTKHICEENFDIDEAMKIATECIETMPKTNREEKVAIGREIFKKTRAYILENIPQK